MRGRPLAVDTACTDACVDYRAVVDPPDPRWVTAEARKRLKLRYGADWARGSGAFTAWQRADLLAGATADVGRDVAEMWATLAALYQPAGGDAAAAVDRRAAGGGPHGIRPCGR